MLDAKILHEAQGLILTLQDFTERMSTGERAFVEDMSDRLDKYGDETFVSENQLAWLQRLEKKYA